MEKKTKKAVLVELNKEELVEINGGSERKNEKSKEFWKAMWQLFKA